MPESGSSPSLALPERIYALRLVGLLKDSALLHPGVLDCLPAPPTCTGLIRGPVQRVRTRVRDVPEEVTRMHWRWFKNHRRLARGIGKASVVLSIAVVNALSSELVTQLLPFSNH